MLSRLLLLLPVILEVSSASPAKLHLDHAFNRTERDQECNEDEYRDNGKCCKNCPAGTRVSMHCTENHARGACEACTAGEDYTAAPSGVETCLDCLICTDDKVMVKECTPKTDRICECKRGSYCSPDEPCEMCRSCLRCGEGQRIKEPCTPTTNTVCEDASTPEPTSTQADVKGWQTGPIEPTDRPPGPTSDPNMALVIVTPVVTLIAIIVVIALVCFYCKKKAKENSKDIKNSLIGPTQNNSENASLASIHPEDERLPPEEQRLMSAEAPQVEIVVNQKAMPYVSGSQRESGEDSPDEPVEGDVEYEEGPELGALCQECGKPQPCDQQWDTFFYAVIDSVRPECVLELVRKLHLQKATIEQTLKDNPNNCKEQNYKLLSEWRIYKGKQASMKAVLKELKDMDLGGCCENIVNNLRSKKIPTN